MGMTTDQKGVIAFARVLIEAAKKEIPVSVPTLPARYDLVLDYGGRLYRAQIKYADSKSPPFPGRGSGRPAAQEALLHQRGDRCSPGVSAAD